MYTLPRCLITGGAEIDVHPATVPDYWGAEIDVHPATVPDYWGAVIDWGPRSMYALPWCLITGGPRSMYTLPRSTAEIDWGPRSMYTLSWCLITGGRDRCTPCMYIHISLCHKTLCTIPLIALLVLLLVHDFQHMHCQ